MKKILALCCLLLGLHAQAQLSGPLQERLESLLELVLEENESADVEQLLSELQSVHEHPILLQHAKAEDFEVLFFLTPIQVEALLNYRDQYGPVLTAFELAAIDGFTVELAELTGEFVDFSNETTIVKRKFVKNELLLRASRLLEEQSGFESGRFEGSPEKLYMRYRYRSSVLQMGYTAEKDAGESFFAKSNPNGFDYNSGFVRWEFGQKRSSLLFGDYVVQWGQGLALWQGFSMGKSTEVERIARFNQGIKAYSSTDENNFMRGIAGDFRFGKFQFQPFLSLRPFDANADSVDARLIFTSFQTSGLHRTASEIEDKNAVDALTGGARFLYNSGRLQIGVQGVHTRYQYPIERSDDLYNRYLFAGSTITNASVDFRFTLNKFYWFGELAGSSTCGGAGLCGIQYQPVDQLAFSALYRNVSKKYNSPWSSAFSENSRVNDEQGLFLGIKTYPAPYFSVYGYVDFFQYKWIKYTTAAPAKGWEAMIRADYRLAQDWTMYARYFYESKPVKLSSSVMRMNLEQIRQSVRLQMKGTLSENWEIRTRLERSFYRHDHRSDGIFVSQDISWDSKRASRINFRLAYFKTDDYDSRIYSYEDDVLYQFSIPAFYGDGFRSYLNVKVKICEKIDFWLKGSRTWYLGVDSIGSGDTAIGGSKRSELKLQLRFSI